VTIRVGAAMPLMSASGQANGVSSSCLSVGGAAVALRVGDDDPATRGEPGQQRAEVRGGHVRAVQQQDGDPVVLLTVDLVVHLQAVDGGVAGARHARHTA
jgi:hypothetical protein